MTKPRACCRRVEPYGCSDRVSSREFAGQRELAQSASQIALTRLWREQITIRDREEARYKLGEAERPLRFRSG